MLPFSSASLIASSRAHEPEGSPRSSKTSPRSASASTFMTAESVGKSNWRASWPRRAASPPQLPVRGRIVAGAHLHAAGGQRGPGHIPPHPHLFHCGEAGPVELPCAFELSLHAAKVGKQAEDPAAREPVAGHLFQDLARPLDRLVDLCRPPAKGKRKAGCVDALLPRVSCLRRVLKGSLGGFRSLGVVACGPVNVAEQPVGPGSPRVVRSCGEDDD